MITKIVEEGGERYMFDFVKIIATVIVILFLIELLELPNWLKRKLTGNLSKKEMQEELNSLKLRVRKLEEKEPK